MNSCSNIEIVNFDNFDEEEEDCMKNLFNANSKDSCELYNLNNLLANDRIETESSQDYTDNRSCSGYSDCYIANSTSNSILTEQLNFSENFKCLDLNDDSFSINPRDNSYNSFSYTPLKLNMRQKFGRSSLYSSQENSINLENVEYECADENENIVLVEFEEIRKQKKSVDGVKDKNFKVHKKDYSYENKKIKNKKDKTSVDNKRSNLNDDSECNNQRDSFENNEDKKTNYSNGNKTDSNKLKLFKCSYAGCAKAYKSKENMILHMKNIHLKEKPYTCKFCNVSFSHRNGNLSSKLY